MTDAQVEAALVAWKNALNGGANYNDGMRAALAAAQAGTADGLADVIMHSTKSAHANGFAAGIETAASGLDEARKWWQAKTHQDAETRLVIEVLEKRAAAIRALRPLTTPAKNKWGTCPECCAQFGPPISQCPTCAVALTFPPLSASQPTGAPSEEDMARVLEIAWEGPPPGWPRARWAAHAVLALLRRGDKK